MPTLRFPDGSAQHIDAGATTAEELLLRAGLNPYEVILCREGHMIPEDTVIADDDEIRVVTIVHGG
jgi:sulfur carrier protein ThiS